MDHHASRVFKGLTPWPREQEHFDIFVAVICPQWMRFQGCVGRSVTQIYAVCVELFNKLYRNSSSVIVRFFSSYHLYFALYCYCLCLGSYEFMVKSA